MPAVIDSHVYEHSNPGRGQARAARQSSSTRSCRFVFVGLVLSPPSPQLIRHLPARARDVPAEIELQLASAIAGEIDTFMGATSVRSIRSPDSFGTLIEPGTGMAASRMTSSGARRLTPSLRSQLVALRTAPVGAGSSRPPGNRFAPRRAGDPVRQGFGRLVRLRVTPGLPRGSSSAIRFSSAPARSRGPDLVPVSSGTRMHGVLQGSSRSRGCGSEWSWPDDGSRDLPHWTPAAISSRTRSGGRRAPPNLRDLDNRPEVPRLAPAQQGDGSPSRR